MTGPEQERRIGAQETSLTYFLRCRCIVSGLASDFIFVREFHDTYLAFVQVHVGLKAVAVTKRELNTLGITHDRLRITHLTLGEEDWYSPLRDAKLFNEPKPVMIPHFSRLNAAVAWILIPTHCFARP